MCGVKGVGWRGGKRLHQKFPTMIKCVSVGEGKRKGEEGKEGEGVRKGGRGEKENDLLNLCTFSLAEVSHDDHQLLLEESL